MRIVDTAGNELQLENIDFTIGRLLQSIEEDTMIFTTWEELPDVDESGNVIDHTPHPTTEQRVDTLDEQHAELSDELTMTQVAVTEIYEMLIPEEE